MESKLLVAPGIRSTARELLQVAEFVLLAS